MDDECNIYSGMSKMWSYLQTASLGVLKQKGVGMQRIESNRFLCINYCMWGLFEVTASWKGLPR